MVSVQDELKEKYIYVYVYIPIEVHMKNSMCAKNFFCLSN